MKQRLKMERHEFMYGPHFNEKSALKAVSKMKNEDGTVGAHWNLELTTHIAEKYGITFRGEPYNKYDWYVALNMIYSDFYKVSIQHTDSESCLVELTKAWLSDKDVEEGKMWYYYNFIMCDKLREEIFCDEDEDEDDDDDIEEERYRSSKYYSKNASRGRYTSEEYYPKVIHERRVSKY